MKSSLRRERRLSYTIHLTSLLAAIGQRLSLTSRCQRAALARPAAAKTSAGSVVKRTITSLRAGSEDLNDVMPGSRIREVIQVAIAQMLTYVVP